MKTFFTTAILSIIQTFVFAQAPQGIPYQAVMRNADGSVMASSAVNLIFMIHEGTANGTVVYQESHALTSNTQGLVSCVVGKGVVSQGNFANINWGSGAKFLQVMMGTTDLGTQQMLSVPYALYSETTNVSVSATGDTLTIGGNSVIVPGISAANPISLSNYGSILLPGNTTCQNELISVTGCGGQDSLLYYDRYYSLVEIGGQCWFAENLATDKYSNGDMIPTGLDNAAWQSTTAGAYAIYNNDPANDFIYGKLYNWYTTVDASGLCPAGWHVPTDCDWMYLEGSLGMTTVQQQIVDAFRGNNQGGALKLIDIWNTPNIGATNSSQFSIVPSGMRMNVGFYSGIGGIALIWTSTTTQFDQAYLRMLASNNSGVSRNDGAKQNGLSVRCVRD